MIGDKGCNIIMNSIVNNNITILNLGMNCITENGIMIIASILEKKTNFELKINVKSQLCSTNITHFLHFFFKLDGYSNIISKNKKIKIIKLKKDKEYNEIEGFFSLKTSNGNILKIQTSKKNKFPFYFKIINKYDNYKIYFKNNSKIIINKNNYEKIIPFPISSKTTKKILNKKTQIDFPNLEKDKTLSIFLLNFINNRII